MYVVLRGEMEVLKKSKRATEARVALLGPGDWFGEMSIVDIQPRSATVRALAPGRLLRISAADLDALYRYDLRSYSLIVLTWRASSAAAARRRRHPGRPDLERARSVHSPWR